MLYSSGQATMSLELPRLHIQLFFSKQEASRRWVAHGSPEKINVRETVGRKNNCKLKFLFNVLHSK